MATDLVSVIVPVYKAEKDIEVCLNSIMDQTYPDLEVILVDDGSPDSCPRICDTWAKKDTRVRVIHQENAGVSAARNAGIQAAKGVWIVFLDADDRMAPEAIEQARMLAQERDCDTVCWNCYTESDGNIRKYPAIRPNDCVYQGKQMRETFIEALYQTRRESFYPGQMFRAVWGKLLSADVIRRHGLAFPVGQPLGEDAAFLVDYFQACRKVLLVDRYWNFYQVSPLSAVGKYRSNIKELQMAELKLLSEKVHAEDVDMDTILLNQYLQFDYQYIRNLYKKEKNSFVIYKSMAEYVRARNYQWKHLRDYDQSKIHKKSMPVAWSMVHGMVCLETLLCMLREWKHHSK